MPHKRSSKLVTSVDCNGANIDLLGLLLMLIILFLDVPFTNFFNFFCSIFFLETELGPAKLNFKLFVTISQLRVSICRYDCTRNLHLLTVCVYCRLCSRVTVLDISVAYIVIGQI